MSENKKIVWRKRGDFKFQEGLIVQKQKDLIKIAPTKWGGDPEWYLEQELDIRYCEEE
jgi:hypothetical protein